MKKRLLLSTMLIISVLLSVFTVFFMNTFAGEKSAKPVELIYGKISKTSFYNPYPSLYAGYKFTGLIEVDENYNENVIVHYTLDNHTWVDQKADFYTKLEGGRHIYKFEISSSNLSDPYSAAKSTVSARFAIKGFEGKNEYWDNNGGKDYNISEGYYAIYRNTVMPNKNVLRDEGTVEQIIDQKNFKGTITVKNIQFTKDVTVRYSLDNWKTSHDIKASFKNQITERGTPYDELRSTDLENWYFSTELPDEARKVQYAIRYTVDDKEFWDNNFGMNYVISGP